MIFTERSSFMKNAVVTGASTGIGRATSIAFAKAGYKVFLVARSSDKLQQVADEISGNGGSAEVITTDLSDISSINKLIDTIKTKADSISALANIAGIWHGKDEVYADVDFQNFDQQVILDTYTVGFTAPTLLVHGLLPLMQQGSRIVNLSGTFENGAKGWLPYYASKRAIEDLTVGLSQELADSGIKVNCVSPSDTATESYAKHFPQYMEDAIAPEKIADEIVKLCSEANQENGKVIIIKQGKEPFENFHG